MSLKWVKNSVWVGMTLSSAWASEVDAEILKDLDFYMNMDVAEDLGALEAELDSAKQKGVPKLESKPEVKK
jgi:hypothetical protein